MFSNESGSQIRHDGADPSGSIKCRSISRKQHTMLGRGVR